MGQGVDASRRPLEWCSLWAIGPNSEGRGLGAAWGARSIAPILACDALQQAVLMQIKPRQRLEVIYLFRGATRRCNTRGFA